MISITPYGTGTGKLVAADPGTGLSDVPTQDLFNLLRDAGFLGGSGGDRR